MGSKKFIYALPFSDGLIVEFALHKSEGELFKRGAGIIYADLIHVAASQLTRSNLCRILRQAYNI